MAADDKSTESVSPVDAAPELPVEDGEGRPEWREVFRQAFDRARRRKLPANRSGLGRDHSRSLFLLVAAAVAILLLFLGVFSSPNRSARRASGRTAGTPNLGNRTTPGAQSAAQNGSPTPLLNAQNTGTGPTEGNGVTPEDVNKTARPVPSVPATRPSANVPQAPGKPGPYALRQIDVSDLNPPQHTAAPDAAAKQESDELRKTSLVFVQSAQTASSARSLNAAAVESNDSLPVLSLPPGTKLVARLQSVVTTAVKAPVIAAIEYNYERDGEIVVPAGAKAQGTLQEADRSGNVGLRFSSIEMPDGTTAKIDATSMSLAYGPLKGAVSGKKTGTNFLVRTFTGLGQAATYLVGSGGLSAPLSESAFLRDRIATNIGIASDQELNTLTFNQNIVVTVPGNTRFYIVMEQGSASPESSTQRAPSQPAAQQANNVPSLEELRELLQLRQEMNAMYEQTGVTQPTAQPAPQQ